jgi:hypothetical protein
MKNNDYKKVGNAVWNYNIPCWLCVSIVALQSISRIPRGCYMGMTIIHCVVYSSNTQIVCTPTLYSDKQER